MAQAILQLVITLDKFARIPKTLMTIPTRRSTRCKGDGAWTVCRHGAKYQVYNFGPITSALTIYEDFYTYKSGIYSHTWGKKVGYHIVRLLGWGKENGVEYWIAANSWNSEWGDNGTFKIKANVDECNFEEFFSLSFPKDKTTEILQ